MKVEKDVVMVDVNVNEEAAKIKEEAGSRPKTHDSSQSPKTPRKRVVPEDDAESAGEEEPPSKRARTKPEATSKAPKTKTIIKEEPNNQPSNGDAAKKISNKTTQKGVAFSGDVKDEDDVRDGKTKPKKAEKTHKDTPRPKRQKVVAEESEADEHDEPSPAVKNKTKPIPVADTDKDAGSGEESASDVEQEEDSEDEKPEIAAKAREKVQSTLTGKSQDPYPDWKPGEPVPYAALCTTFSKIEMTTKRLEIQAHCSLFIRQVLRLTPDDLLPTIQLMINKLAADYTGIELGIGESLIMKAIGETTGRSLAVIKADQNEIGDLGLVAAKSRSNQPTMFKPKPLSVRGVHEGLMAIAVVEGQGAQGRKVGGIKKLLSAADAHLLGKGSKGIDITKDKGGASEAKFIIRALEGKMRLGLADKTVLISLAQAMVTHELSQDGKPPTTDKLAKGESILKSVYR